MRVIPSLISAEVKPVMEACAEELVQLMRSIAPKDTGKGAGSIGWTWGDAPKGAISLDTVKVNDRASRIIIYAAGGEQFYMRFQEFGTKEAAARPFFWPAYRSKKASIRRRLAAAVRAGIAKANT